MFVTQTNNITYLSNSQQIFSKMGDFMYERFLQLLKEKGITAYRVGKDTNISQTTLSSWKKGISQPKLDKLQIIADYFNVSIEWLMGTSNIKEKTIISKENIVYVEKKEDFTDEERTIIKKYRCLPEAGKATVRVILDNQYDTFMNTEEQKTRNA